MHEVLSRPQKKVFAEVKAKPRCPFCKRQVMPGEGVIQLLERAYHSICITKQISVWIRR